MHSLEIAFAVTLGTGDVAVTRRFQVITLAFFTIHLIILSPESCGITIV